MGGSGGSGMSVPAPGASLAEKRRQFCIRDTRSTPLKKSVGTTRKRKMMMRINKTSKRLIEYIILFKKKNVNI